MTPAAIITALQTALKNSADLSYVNDENIFIGSRGNILNHPALEIEIGPDKKARDENVSELRTQTVFIVGTIKIFDESKQIIGTSSLPGLADFMNHVKKAMSADYTLGGACINLSVGDGDYDQKEDYPIRRFAISSEILYRQNRLTRE